MKRVPEPELMDDPAQALAYAQADFEEPHSHCVRLALEKLGPLVPAFGTPLVVDLGCGPGDVTLRLAENIPGCEIIGVDAAAAMLELARSEAVRRGLGERIRFVEARIGQASAQLGPPALIFSSSVLHHLADPAELWSAVQRLAVPGSQLFVMDLMRPHSLEEADAMLERYASGEPEILRHDFHASLLAAYEAGEIEAQLVAQGLDGLRVEVVSDRHWIAYGEIAATG